jgi:hypothetical protein
MPALRWSVAEDRTRTVPAKCTFASVSPPESTPRCARNPLSRKSRGGVIIGHRGRCACPQIRTAPQAHLPDPTYPGLGKATDSVTESAISPRPIRYTGNRHTSRRRN